VSAEKVEVASAVAGLRGGVIVSCQAAKGSPLDQPAIIAALARSAESGGARGFRIDGPENVAAVRAVSTLPIIGIRKMDRPESEVRITATLEDALSVITAGATIVALDGTARPRPGHETLEDIVSQLHERGVPVMADVATAAEAEAAIAAGADMVGTTLAGYTSDNETVDRSEPAFELLKAIAGLPVPVIVEGRIWTPAHVERAFRDGAHAVVIGTAITAPNVITRRFVDAAVAAAIDR
jgi:N-acylglucosamine-6-phosphate 2-epimerase